MSIPTSRMPLIKDIKAREYTTINIKPLTQVFLTNEFTNNSIVPFLDNHSLCLFSRTCKTYRNLATLSRVKALLYYVLNPSWGSLDKMEKLLSNEKLLNKKRAKTKHQAEAQSIILTRVNGAKELCMSENHGLITKRSWNYKMSPLEAAFKICGDFHLVQLLLNHVPHNQKPLALEQLQNVKAECSPRVPGNYLYDLTLLHAAYTKFLNISVPIAATINLTYPNELHRLVAFLGDAQKNQPWFILQCLNYPGRLFPDEIFLKEPCRGNIISIVAFESLGSRAQTALCRDLMYGDYSNYFRIQFMNNWHGVVESASIDIEIYENLQRVIISKFDNLIESLENEIELSTRPRKSFFQNFCCSSR